MGKYHATVNQLITFIGNIIFNTMLNVLDYSNYVEFPTQAAQQAEDQLGQD